MEQFSSFQTVPANTKTPIVIAHTPPKTALVQLFVNTRIYVAFVPSEIGFLPRYALLLLLYSVRFLLDRIPFNPQLTCFNSYASSRFLRFVPNSIIPFIPML
jgi:hypothetical protein